MKTQSEIINTLKLELCHYKSEYLILCLELKELKKQNKILQESLNMVSSANCQGGYNY